MVAVYHLFSKEFFLLMTILSTTYVKNWSTHKRMGIFLRCGKCFFEDYHYHFQATTLVRHEN